MIIISKKYSHKISEEYIRSLLEEILKKTPFKKGKNKSLYLKDNIFIKCFRYSFNLRFKGFQCYYMSNYLIKKGINVPEPIFYVKNKRVEFFGYKKVDGIEFNDFLKIKKTKNELDQAIDGIKEFIFKLFHNKIYHSDFDPTNILIDKKNNFYLIDVESIVPFLTIVKKDKMLKKLNKFLLKYFGFTIDKTELFF